ASAGIIGAAIAFGAQNLIKDYVSGISVILEDQYGVGDIVDLGPAVGTVENVTLRVTQLRDTSGVVWYVRNGEILRVANRSKGWTVSIVDVPVAYSENLAHVREVIERVADDMDADPHYDSMLLERPAYAGVESVAGDAMFIRITAKSAPNQQVSVSRAIRERLKIAFDEAGIKVPVLARASIPGTSGSSGSSPAGAGGTS
ncbi:MAG: mechanosensitive ion channel, partial [Candidatus Nanopelagicales bacterium]|nr:mechanosensitive ion channel [Candidatus Nanopelagicales bacterium]